MNLPRGEEQHTSPLALLSGFAVAVFLTLLAYIFTVDHVFIGWPLMIVVLVLGVLQMAVQLVYFLQLGRGSKAHWKLVLVCITVFIVCVLVAGSVWIMSNLNTRMTPQQMNDYMNSQQSF